MDHYTHSTMIRFMKLKTEPVKGKPWDLGKETIHSLKSPFDGYLVAIYFYEDPEHPDHIFIRSTNWRAENEPSGWVSKQNARDIYRRLLKAGFTAF